ncbi:MULTISPECIES: hypothetical protein [Porphyromonas]|nr:MULTISPECIES: hypothetical protein [Porphyromonas]
MSSHFSGKLRPQSADFWDVWARLRLFECSLNGISEREAGRH